MKLWFLDGVCWFVHILSQREDMTMDEELCLINSCTTVNVLKDTTIIGNDTSIVGTRTVTIVLPNATRLVIQEAYFIRSPLEHCHTSRTSVAMGFTKKPMTIKAKIILL